MARWHSLGLIVALLSISAGAMRALQSQSHHTTMWYLLNIMSGSLTLHIRAMRKASTHTPCCSAHTHGFYVVLNIACKK